MSSDLVSLHLLMVTASGPQRELWREGAAMASIPIDFDAGDAAAAKIVLAKGGVDICVLDQALSDDDKAAVIKAARRSKNPAPIVFVSAPRGSVRPDNIDGALPKATNADDARKLVETCIRVKMPTKVLIAGDSGTTRGVVHKVLAASRFDLDIHEASENSAALSQLRAGSFGMVFLDRGMLGLNGADPLAQIRREVPNVAIIIMTSDRDDADAARSKLRGTLALLKKPFYPADVDAVLERYYGLHQSDAS